MARRKRPVTTTHHSVTFTDGTTYRVVLAIDEPALVTSLTRRALANRHRRASLHHGAVTCIVTPE